MTAESLRAEAIHEYVKHGCIGERSPGDVVAYQRGVGAIFGGDIGGTWAINAGPGLGSFNLYLSGGRGQVRTPGKSVWLHNGMGFALLVKSDDVGGDIDRILRRGK